MVTDLERLVVLLEASITKYERAMTKALGVTQKNMRDIEQRTDQAMTKVESRMSRMGRQTTAIFAGVRQAWIGAFAGAAAFRGAQQLIDASTRIENALKVTGLAGEELTRVYERLYNSAQRNMAPVETLATLYSRLGLSQSQLGVTNEEMLVFTDKVALALRVQGTSAQEARGALIQLSQAMGAGIVRAEEFNSIVEGAPSILRATAAGLKEADGSVAKLRQLVIDGKLSSEAFFRAFLTGSQILEGQVANAEVTVSQQFIRLQNVLVDTAGKFNDATGAGDALGSAIARLASDIDDFGNFLDQHGEGVRSFFQAIADGLAAIDEHGGALADLMGRGEWNILGYGSNLIETFTQAEVTVRSLTDQILASENLVFAPGLGDELDGIISKLEAGEIGAQDAVAALRTLAAENLDFSLQIGQLAALIEQLEALEQQALSTPLSAGSPSSRGRPLKRKPQVAIDPVSIDDYPVDGLAGGSGSKSQQLDAYQRALKSREDALRLLEMETELQRSLNPLVNDYGYALEKARVQHELENAAAEAGLELTPQRREEIEKLAESYGTATANAARLAEEQDKIREAAEAMGEAARDALETIIDGLIESKDAGEIFASVLRDVGRALINAGISGFGSVFKIPGWDSGGYTGPGGKHQPAGIVHKGEYVFSKEATQRAGVGNLEVMHRSLRGYASGGLVGVSAPTIPRIPSMGAANDNGSVSVPISINIDATGADAAGLARLHGELAQLRAELPGRVQEVVRTRGRKWK